MAQIISTGNDSGQPKIFPIEIVRQNKGLLQWPMGKTATDDGREIHLGDWLDLFGLKQAEAGRVAGCSQSYIANISRGARNQVNARYLLKLSEHLGVTMNDFFIPAPTKNDSLSLLPISAQARESVIKRWRELEELAAEKSAKKRSSGKR